MALITMSYRSDLLKRNIVFRAYLPVDRPTEENGRDLELDSSREFVCILDGDDIAAVYRRMENGMYHCERGLF